MSKIAAALIVKATDEESELLERCLESINGYVDEIFITITGDNEKCSNVAARFGAKTSRFEWIKDFSAARNFNFSTINSDYTHILWLDADDVVVGAPNLRRIAEAMEAKGVKGAYAPYLYDFDEHGNCTVRHLKIRIVQNDGTFTWGSELGELHEDLIPSYNAPTTLLSETEPEAYVEIKHLTSEDRVKENSKRNFEIAKGQRDKYPGEPRAIWNYANSCIGVSDPRGAREAFREFIGLSGSDEERYIAYIRIGYICTDLNEGKEAVEAFLAAATLFPWYPDAYIGLGTLYYKQDKWRHAKEYLIQGMSKEISDTQTVHTPRVYDLQPLKLLANCYYGMGKPRECQAVLKKIIETFPLELDDKTEKMFELINESVKESEVIENLLESSEQMDDIKLLAELESLPEKLQAHPQVCILRNERFPRAKPPVDEIVYFCGFTEERWDRSSEEKGIGGSEEAVLNLSRRWANSGKTVVIYNNCGTKEKTDVHGVIWRPYWMFNPRDAYDTLILWRHPIMAERPLDANLVLLDVHDVLPEAELTSNRLANIDKILVKSKFHRSLFPSVPDEKFVIINNGIDLAQFEGEEVRVPKSLIYTSSADRGLEHLLDMWPEVISKHPDATLNVYYGWGVFDATHASDPVMMNWKQEMEKKMEQPGIVVHGRVGHKEIARRMKQAHIYAYPCHFEEISCISFMKAVASKCVVVSTNYAALAEYTDASQIEKGEWKKYLGLLLDAMEGSVVEAQEDMSKYDWDNISKQWLKL